MNRRKWLSRLVIGITVVVVGLLIEYAAFKGKITLGILDWLEQAWLMLFINLTVPIWLIANIFLLGLVLPLVVLGVAIALSDESENKDLPFVEGVYWEWKKEPGTLTRDRFTPICPECGMAMELKNRLEEVEETSEGASKTFTKPTGSEVHCEGCGFEHSWDRIPKDLAMFVGKDVERQVRTGEWSPPI
jgi:hypothetical protein